VEEETYSYDKLIGKPVNQDKESGVVELQKAGSPAQFF